MTTPKQEFVEYVRSLGLPAEESETYDVLEARVAKKFATKDTPEQMEPMTAEDATENPEPYWDDDDWVAEQKLDGIRMLMHFHGGRIRLTTRGKDPKTYLYNEKTANYPQFHSLYDKQMEGTILDGEMVASPNDPRPRIAAIQAVNGALPEQAIENQKKFGLAEYWVFDIIRFGGSDVSSWPWWQRKALLDGVLPRKKLHSPYTVRGTFKKGFYEKICRGGGEGIMLKHRSSKYKPSSRENCWLKVKRYDDMEVVITGWSPGAGKHEGKVGACTVSIPKGRGNGLGFMGYEEVGAFGNMTDELRDEMTAKDGSLKAAYYYTRVLVRYQPPLKGLMRHCRLIKFLEEMG